MVRRQAEEARRTLQAALQATGQDLRLHPTRRLTGCQSTRHVGLERLDDQARQWDELQRKGVRAGAGAASAMEPRWEEAGRRGFGSGTTVGRWRWWRSAWDRDALPSEAEQVLDGLGPAGPGETGAGRVCRGELTAMSARVRTFTGMVERITAAVAGGGARGRLPPDVAVELLYSRLGQAPPGATEP